MMPAAKHFDPVLGIDIHLIQPPGPVPPVPIPHPFIGFLIDPMDYVPIIGSTVLVNGVHRAQAGTAGKCVPSHIPIGGTFIKPPGNECEMFMGSATVDVDGDAFSYLALPALSCQCIGMPPIPRLKKKSKIKSLLLPTSVVLPIPAGPPVLVGGPPTISLMVLGMKAAMAGLGKAFKKLRKTKAFKKAKSKFDNVRAKFKGKKKGKSPANKGSCEGGCPVDAITGAVVERLEDYRLPGEIPFVWKRYYDSRWSADDSPMGRGWRHEYQRTLAVTRDGFLFTDGSGETFELPPVDPETGVSVWAGFEVTRIASRKYRLRRRGEPDMEFDFSPSGKPAPLARLRSGAKWARLAYDEQGNLVAAAFDGGPRVRMTHNSRGLITSVEVERDGKWREISHYAYDQRDALVRHTDALGHSTVFAYDRAGRLGCMKNRLGYEILYAYDDAGRCVRTWGQDGLYDERFEYYPELNQSIRRSANGAEWVFTYDAHGTAVEIMDPYGDRRQFVLDDLGQVILDVDEIGQETELLYDSWGGHCGRRTSLGDIHPPRHVDLHPPERPLVKLPQTPLEWRWGGLVRPDRIAAAMRSTRMPNATIGEVRDGMERLVSQTDRRGRTQQWRYDAQGNPIEHVDADGRAYRTEIASWNLARRRFDPNGAAVQYEYNLHEYVTKVVDPGGAVSEYVYDLKDRIAEVRRHGAVREKYAWDGAGNLIEKRDAADRVLLRIGIGPNGLPSKRSLASGETHEMEYDALGHVIRAATGSSETILQRDGAGRVLADLRDSLGTQHTLAFGRVSETVVFAGFRTEFDFDRNGGATITDPTGRTIHLRYGNDGQIERTFADGASEKCAYDADGHLLERVVVQSGAEASTTRFVYSPGGDLLERHDANGVARFEYDAAHRLIAETSPGGVRVEYDRDLAGNLLRMPGLHGVQLMEGNRLVAANGATCTYNDRNHIASRTSADGQVLYEYDSQDMLVRAVIDGQPWTAEYDPLGRRIRKTWQGQTTEFYWDDNRLAAEVRPDQSCRIYLYADLEALVPIMMIDFDAIDADPKQGRVYHLIADQRGCIDRALDASGETVWSASIDPYGTAHVDPASEIELHLRMPGHYLDPETGLHDNRFRSYSPELGRYLQSDPAGQSGGYNLYAYCHNPLTHVDLVGWDHSNDLGGSKKSKNAESPSPAKMGDSAGAEAVAAKGGMDPGHLKNLQKHCADNNRMVVMRAGNEASVPHIKDPNGVPKPVECKLNTAKSGDNAGKVTTGQSPDKWKPKSEGGSGYQDNLDQLKKDGYSVEDGVIKNPDGKHVHGDYDMQGVYDKGPDGNYGPPKKSDGTPYDKGTNDPEFQRDMNDGLNDPANYDGPDKDMVQHGANDDFKNKDGSQGRQPGADENYVVVDENGTAHYVEGTDNLKNVYDEKGIPWPY